MIQSRATGALASCSARPTCAPACTFTRSQPRVRPHDLQASAGPVPRHGSLASDTGARSSGVRCAAAPSGMPAAEDVRPSLQLPEQEEWDECMAQLTALELPETEAMRVLAKGFGWLGQGYWRSEKVNEPPRSDQVEGNLHFLQETLGIKGADLQKVLKMFPEVLGISKEGLLEPNVNRLKSDWKMDGAVLTRALIRKPQLMGLSVDCEGTCQGLCSKCWAAN